MKTNEISDFNFENIDSLSKTNSNFFSNKGGALLFSTLMTLSMSFTNSVSSLPLPQNSDTNTPGFISNNKKKMKKSFMERYNQISKSDWFLHNYANMSVGDLITLDK